MKPSITRCTASLVLAVQWISVAALILAGIIGMPIFKGFGTALPIPAIVALRLICAASLIPIAALTTIIVFVAEWFIKSERARFVIQIVNLCLWLIFTSFVLAALMLPLTEFGMKLS